MQQFMSWLTDTGLAHLVTRYTWGWPIAESVHFTGLVLLFGIVAAFDLRLLGVAKSMRPKVLHDLLPWGLVGLAMLAITGAAFISAAPDQYFYNRAFYVKATALMLLGINATYFYAFEYRSVRVIAAGGDSSARQKLIAALSLSLLVVVMCAGRMLTFFRPPAVL